MTSYQFWIEQAQRWQAAVDYGSPMTAWTPEMLSNRRTQMPGSIYVCPDCGGENVQAFVAYFENPNTNEQEYYGLAEAYPDLYYCQDCCDAKPSLAESDRRRDDHPHYARITWGLDCDDGVDIDPDDVIEETYRFKTKAELDAFMLGVEEGCGWLGKRIEEDSREQ